MATGTRPIKAASAGAVVAYLQDRSDCMGYYSEGDGFDVAWGKLAQEWGLERGLTREQWENVFNGKSPDGAQLSRARDDRVPLHDMTISFPKSLAELMVVADDELREKLQQAAMTSARAGWDWFEQHGLVARRRSKVLVGDHYESVQRRYTADLLCTPVLQHAARPTKQTEERGAPPDPSIHVHLAIFSLCRLGEDWYTADNWGFKKAAEHVDAVAMGEMARQLELLGIPLDYSDIDRSKNGKVRWEVAGSERETRDFWSTNRDRRWEIIEGFEREYGKPITEEELRRRMHLTRRKKSDDDKDQDVNPDWELWRADAEAHDIPLLTVERQPIERDPYASLAELRERLVGQAGLVRDGAVFDETVISQSVRRCAIGLGFSPEELAGYVRILMNSPDLVSVRDAEHEEERLWTTREVLDAERRIAIARQQKAAHWVDITGKAGTGKSFAVSVAVEALRTQIPRQEVYEGEPVTIERSPIAEAVKAAATHRDRAPDDEQMAAIDAIFRASRNVEQVVCVSMAGTTAERTGLKIRADHYGSVESICGRIDRKALRVDSKTLVVIEEAGQLDTLRMDRLLKAVGDARIVTLGDPYQLSPLGAGGWYQDALDRHRYVELAEVRRQVDPQDIRDFDRVREGHATEAVRSLDERGRVHGSKTDAERVAQIFADYKSHREHRQAEDIRVVLDTSNHEVDTVNRFIQRDRLNRGEIGHESVVCVDEHIDRRWELHEGDLIVLNDGVRIPGKEPVKNGAIGTVTQIDPQLGRVTVRFENGRVETVPAAQALPRYAVHIQKEQGGEAAIVLCVPGRMTTREAAYTELTRGIEESHIYWSQESHGDLGKLGALMERTSVQESASRQVTRLREQERPRELKEVRTEEIEPDLPPLPAEIRPRSNSLGFADHLLPKQELKQQSVEQQRLAQQSLEQNLEQRLRQERDRGGR